MIMAVIPQADAAPPNLIRYFISASHVPSTDPHHLRNTHAQRLIIKILVVIKYSLNNN